MFPQRAQFSRYKFVRCGHKGTVQSSHGRIGCDDEENGTNGTAAVQAVQAVLREFRKTARGRRVV